MQVGLVARCLNTDHVRGMGRYVQELLRQSATDSALHWRLYSDDPAKPLHVPPGFRGEVDVFSFRGDRFQLWEQLGLPLRVRRKPVDLLHCTEGTLPRWQPVPTVVTLHDTLAWQEHDGSAQALRYWDSWQPAALRRCAHIITISESSRRDILARWPELGSKVTVIPHGIADEYLQTSADAPQSVVQQSLGESPYLVYLGGPLARKRFDWAVRVLSSLNMPDLRLVACGFSADARHTAGQGLPVDVREKVHFAPFLADAELRALYQGAAAVLYPTEYEGFGFPAIEAQAAGAPVVFSPVSSLQELVGPLSLTAPLNDLHAWGLAVQQALSLGNSRPQLSAEARQWAQRFSWKRSLEAHLRVYDSVKPGSAAGC
ncbi:hypothetical protein D621_17780 [beta proteobacterium AAP51]|nr:hypothetical protein D621_17780 [beta proteobacterium AAP51]